MPSIIKDSSARLQPKRKLICRAVRKFWHFVCPKLVYCTTIKSNFLA